MSAKFFFDHLDGFIPGAVGEPGARTFVLQARAGEQVVTFKMEKEQVAMLGRYLAQEADRLGGAPADRDVAGLLEPVTPCWVVGTLSAAVDPETRRVHITAEELVLEDLDDDDPFTEEYLDDPDEDLLDELLAAEFPDDVDDDLDDPDGEVDEALRDEIEQLVGPHGVARFEISLGQAVAFAEIAEELMSAGRPPCRLCGRPMEPAGHACPRWN